MTAHTLNQVMDALGVALSTVSGFTAVFDYPPDQAVAPFAFVDYPESLSYDLTYGRGFDRFSVPVYVCVANALARDARDALGVFVDGASVKAAIESNAAGYAMRVTGVTFSDVTVAGSVYPGAVFHVDIAA